MATDFVAVAHRGRCWSNSHWKSINGVNLLGNLVSRFVAVAHACRILIQVRATYFVTWPLRHQSDVGQFGADLANIAQLRLLSAFTHNTLWISALELLFSMQLFKETKFPYFSKENFFRLFPNWSPNILDAWEITKYLLFKTFLALEKSI
jgi:hypothetical protein